MVIRKLGEFGSCIPEAHMVDDRAGCCGGMATASLALDAIPWLLHTFIVTIMYPLHPILIAQAPYVDGLDCLRVVDKHGIIELECLAGILISV